MPRPLPLVGAGAVRRLVGRSKASHVPILSLASRIAVGSVRRKVPRLARPTISVDSRGTKIVADLSTPFGLQLYRYGYNEPEVSILEAILQPGDVFIDGGAHIGIFTVLAASCVGPGGRVIACEPVPENVRLLKENLARNHFTWVDVHSVALAETTGKAQLFSFGSASALSSFAPATRTGSSPITATLSSLDAIARDHMSRIRVIKLDVEGAEVSVLRGAQEVLKYKPDLLVEVASDHLSRQGASVADLENILIGAGYRGYEMRKAGNTVGLIPLERWSELTAGPNLFVSARSPSLVPPFASSHFQ